MKNKFISVIIPVYGVEKYLDRCVESVVNQTYKDLEIILVDDGSPDNCPKMCDEWASRDARIRTVHRENGGLSCARNTGLSAATGDYITFVDSDDWIARDTYEYCMRLFDSNKKANAVQFDVKLTDTEKINFEQPKEVVNVYKNKDILVYYLESTTKGGGFSVCRCLFEASRAKRYRFREGKIYEDIDYKYKVLRDCDEWVVTNHIGYFYWQEGNSKSSGKLKARDLQLYEAAEELYKLCLCEDNSKIHYYGRVKIARTPFSLLCRIALWGIDENSLNKKDITQQLLKEHRKNLTTLLKAPIPVSRKIISVLMALNFKLTRGIMLATKSLMSPLGKVRALSI